MLRSSLTKIALVSGGNAGNAVIGFFYLAVVAKSLSLDDFGKYALLTSILLVFAKLIDFGSNSIYVTKAVQEDSIAVTESFHTIKLIMFTLVTVPAIFVVAYFFPKQPILYINFVLGLIAYTLNFTLYAHLQKDERFVPLILLNTLPSVFKIVAGVLILTQAIQITFISAFTLFSFSIFMDIFLIPQLSDTSRHFRINFLHVQTILRKSVPSAVSQVVQEGWPAVNNGIAKTIRGFSDVGLYALAGKISNIFSLISLSVFTVLLPKNARLKHQNKRYDIRETIVISAGILILALAASIIAGFLVTSVFGNKFEGSLSVLGILIFSAAVTSIHTFTENYFLVENVTKNILLVNISKVVVFLTLAAFLTLKYGIAGLAVANLLAAITALLTTILLINIHSRKTAEINL